MAIEVIKENGRTKIVGSETYENGMTLTFKDPGDGKPRYRKPKFWQGEYDNIELLDMHHARSWLAGEGARK